MPYRLLQPLCLLGIAVLIQTSCATNTPEGQGQPPSAATPRLVPVAEGWAQTSINAVIFRKHALVTHKDTQYVAFYSNDADVMLARRRLGTTAWNIHQTPYRGNVHDAHNAISIALDGRGRLHMAWDHHGDTLRYTQGTRPGALTLTDPKSMIGRDEANVTYPEFYTLPGGDLIFLYRDGSSGNGNLVINRYDVATGTWRRVQSNLLDGEGERNAYWQMTIDPQGMMHLSWVWRESPDVASNHDLGYARSDDGGQTWTRSDGTLYALPITVQNAEYAARIPRNHELINQTAMAADAQGRPYIASYWRPEGTTVPQFHVVYHDGAAWRVVQATERTTPFSLSGGGTRRIPISRPQLVIGPAQTVYLVFRDAERGERVSVGICDDLVQGTWRFIDLTDEPVGAWEPTYDPALWRRDHTLHLLHQRVEQPDGDDRGDTAGTPQPRMISVLEWTP